MQKKLSAIFNKFVGREVLVTEETKTIKLRNLGEHTITQARLDAADTTIAAIRNNAEVRGLRLRVWLPGTMGTMDHRMDRLNVHVEKETDGKYRVKSFRIG